MVNYDKNRQKIAIFTADDSTWALPTWIQTLPGLIQNHDVVGIYLFPDRLGSLQGKQQALWYGQVFGLYNFIVMALYAVKTQARLWCSPISNWYQLSDHYKLQLQTAATPNAPEVVQWTQDQDIDVILIMVGNILKAEIINAPNIGIINKHAGILPSCRGLLPSFWGRLTGMPLGVTFHQVNSGIDTGKALVQVSYPPKQSGGSMLRFYMDTFALYPQLAVQAVENLVNQDYLPARDDLESAYHSLPTHADYRTYRRRSFKIAEFRDLLYQPSIETLTAALKPIKRQSAYNGATR
jgi:methionyl-tRNA formyltransferase